MMKRAVFLFDRTGIMATPWLDAGYECWIVDIQHQPGVKQLEELLFTVNADLCAPWEPPFDIDTIEFVAAFPPCDHLAVSGARWFKGKGLRSLARSIDMFATAAEFCERSQAPYMIENPVSTISTYWRKPDYVFSPHEYALYHVNDNYTKKTCLWTGGGFVMPEGAPLHGLPPPDDRIHKCPPSTDRKNIRSATPMGFARAVFEANSTSIVRRAA